ncbi:CBS domain containing protein [Zea mays]|uniref:CBS domain containing protein n=1 Tax=Zea mays TaxID=4577 RepID=B6SXQ4_MAIZE|nr:CBS domain containing protein [Zea mays]ACG29637.1 CBS domain containing protein [Zea mays]ACN27889.1 unknown [Zea mays]ONM01173.1 CBS domain-containing protein CBSCBSPB2 [Zea mays]|eukprot:NP_001148069.1 CBS domain containing protein [Zea mays]
MSSAASAAPPSRRTRSRPPSASSRKSDDSSAAAANGNGNRKVATKPASPHQLTGERTVKKLRLSKALTIPEGTTVLDACRRMAARRVDAVLLTDNQGLLSGIVTDKDIATRVVAEGLRVEQTIMSKIMTRNPVYVMSDTLAIEALQKMVQGKFRHLPVVENGEVIAMLDIAKCLYEAIARLEKAAEQGSAIAAAVEGVERQLGGNFSAPSALIETLRERMFKPSLSTIVTENTKVAIVSPTDPVCVAAQKMREFCVNSVVVSTGNTLQGIFTSKDILMRVVSQNISPELTLVEKVMTVNPDCATLETTILDTLHIMHDGKFLHIPVIDKDGQIAACLDVLQLTHATIQLVEGGNGTVNNVANSVMQRFWDSALALEPPDEEFDSHSEVSLLLQSEAGDGKSSVYPPVVGNSFSFKLQDRKGRVHRFTCGSESLDELVSSVRQRLSIADEKEAVQLLYEDDEGDRVLLTTDADLAGALLHAKSSGLKVLKLHIEDPSLNTEVTKPSQELAPPPLKSGISMVHVGLTAGVVALSGAAVMVYLKRSQL